MDSQVTSYKLHPSGCQLYRSSPCDCLVLADIYRTLRVLSAERKLYKSKWAKVRVDCVKMVANSILVLKILSNIVCTHRQRALGFQHTFYNTTSQIMQWADNLYFVLWLHWIFIHGAGGIFSLDVLKRKKTYGAVEYFQPIFGFLLCPVDSIEKFALPLRFKLCMHFGCHNILNLLLLLFLLLYFSCFLSTSTEVGYFYKYRDIDTSAVRSYLSHPWRTRGR